MSDKQKLIENAFATNSFIIMNDCMESYPCQHDVIINQDLTIIMNGMQICALLKKNNLPLGHFSIYSTA